MSTAAALKMKKSTHATITLSTVGSALASRSSGKRTPLLVVSVLAVTLALCATTQVLCSGINKTMMPPFAISFEDALEYLSSRKSTQ